MDCTNCGNHIPVPETICQTCGTPRPENPTQQAERLSPADHAVATAGQSPIAKGLLIAVLAGLAVVVGMVVGMVVLLLAVSGGEIEESGDGSTFATELAGARQTDVEQGTEATISEAAVESSAQPWKPARVAGSLPQFTTPDADAALGLTVPTVDGRDFSGDVVSIENDGRPKVIVFLAHWCPHCQAEVPAVQQYLDSNGVPEGVDFISVATSINDERPNYPPDAWLDREGWTAPVIVDPDGAVASAFGLSAFPYYVFVRDDFTVDVRITGEIDPAVVFGYAETLFGPAPLPIAIGPSDYDAALLQPTACGGSVPEPRQLMTFDEPGTADAAQVLTFVTSCGDITVQLDAEIAPETVQSMVFLATERYFDGTICHRLVPGFVLQCGDPTGTGTGGPGYLVADEFPDTGDAYVEGVVAMANAGPGTTGSQFFVVIGESILLPPQFTVIGTVGDIAPLIALLDTVPLGSGTGGEVSAPLETIYIETVRVES